MLWVVMDLGKLKLNARKLLVSNWTTAILGVLILMTVSSLVFLQFIDNFEVLTFVFIGILPIYSGYAKMHVQIAYPKKADLNNIISLFNKNDYFRNMIGMLLYLVYLFFWSLMFILPGIYKALSYAMTPFILSDPDFSHLTGNQAITKSREIMNGHKTEYLVLMLSFTGWIVLSILTLGILFFYTIPYIEQTKAQFYIELEKENN